MLYVHVCVGSICTYACRYAYICICLKGPEPNVGCLSLSSPFFVLKQSLELNLQFISLTKLACLHTSSTGLTDTFAVHSLCVGAEAPAQVLVLVSRHVTTRAISSGHVLH